VTKKSQYAELDSAILDLLAEAPAKFDSIRVRLESMADALVQPDRYGIKVGWRLIDRRLQSLRQAGKIKHGTTKWSLSD